MDSWYVTNSLDDFSRNLNSILEAHKMELQILEQKTELQDKIIRELATANLELLLTSDDYEVRTFAEGLVEK